MAGLNFNSCLVYLDDVIIFAPTLEIHMNRLRNVFERFRSAKLKIRPDKCYLLQREVAFLGYRINKDGVGTDKKKIEAVLNWPTPRNLKEVRSYIGLCSYYRKFVKDFAGIAEPLHALTRNWVKWNWTSDCQEAFEELKRRLTSTLIMALPQDEGTYVLDTDASKCHIGAVLSIVTDGEERVLAYGSRLYSRAETNYCVTRKELLAVIYFTKLYKQYLLGRHFKLRTDHAALRWSKKLQSRLANKSRWLEQLEAFDFEIEHRPGLKHTNADAMSQIPCSQCRGLDEEMELMNVITDMQEEVETEDVCDKRNIAKFQENDVAIGEFYQLKKEFQNNQPEWKDIRGTSDVTKTLWNM